MSDPSSDDDGLPGELERQLVTACRTAIGDQLRSITYFTETTARQAYLRDGLERDADLVGFIENERLGFRSQRAYGASELGDYNFTIRVFDRGYLARIIAGDRGVFVTTDAMPMGHFEELASAVQGVLEESPG